MKIDELDIIHIVTPDQLHREMAEASLAAGKHVLCEKPMALCSADCEEMIATANECGKKLMIGMCLRFDNLYLTLKEIIDSADPDVADKLGGALSKVVAMMAERL